MAYQPKSYKKFVATAATATLVASAVVPVAFAAKPATEFSDVAPQYKDAVDYLVNNTIAAGKTPSTFGTAENIIRVDAAIWIAKATLTDGEISAAPASNFTDVPDRGKIYVDALKSKGYVNGSSATAFNSYANISRGEVALILAEAYDITGNTANNKFTDVNSRYLAAVSALKDNGITSGKTTTRFGTGDAITRGELAIWVYKLENLGALTVSNLNVAVDGSKATVTADVKNAEENADATVSVYPKGDLSATPIVNSTKVVGGQVSTTFNDVPAGTHTVVVKVGEVEASKSFVIAAVATPKVESVTAIDATTVVVKFNTAVEKADAESAELITLVSNKVEIEGVTLTNPTLSTDGKTLTLTATAPIEVDNAKVTVFPVNTKANVNVETQEFVSILNYSDSKVPTILGTDKLSATTVEVSFSEPMKSIGTPTFKLADGTDVTDYVDYEFTPGDSEITFFLGDSNIPVNKVITATFIGAQDQAGNLLSPNPATVTFQKGDVDGVKPVVSTITQTGAKEFVLKFSEQLQYAPTVALPETLGAYTVKKDATDATKYIVTTENALDGATNVGVSNFYDLSGEKGTDFTKVVTFVKDTVAPKVTTTRVVKDSNNVEFLEITYDKAVTEGVLTISGSYVEDFVTTTLTATDVAAKYATTTNEKVLRVALSDFASETGARYTVDAVSKTVESLSGELAGKASATFIRGVDGQTNSFKLGAPTISVVDNDTLNVTFYDAVDGASATNLANYKVDGAVVESASLAAYDETLETQVVTLTLKANSNTFTGIRNITVENVKALGSTVTMNKFVENELSLNENVVPTIKSAKLTSTNTVEVTFSETVLDETPLADFVLYIGGVATETVVTTTDSVSDNKLVLTLGTVVDSDDLAKGLSLKAAPTVDVTDTVGNVVSVPTAVTIAQ